MSPDFHVSFGDISSEPSDPALPQVEILNIEPGTDEDVAVGENVTFDVAVGTGTAGPLPVLFEAVADGPDIEDSESVFITEQNAPVTVQLGEWTPVNPGTYTITFIAGADEQSRTYSVQDTGVVIDGVTAPDEPDGPQEVVATISTTGDGSDTVDVSLSIEGAEPTG